jgi:hypothetical protein
MIKKADQKHLEEVYSGAILKNEEATVTEGISGIYPATTMAQEFGGAIFFAALLLLPFFLEQLRIRLPEKQLKELARKVTSLVKNDSGRDSVKMKISRAVNALIQKFAPNKQITVQQEVLNVLPDNIENKSEDEVTGVTKANLASLKNRNSRYNFRG